jgi:hypothetical protein
VCVCVCGQPSRPLYITTRLFVCLFSPQKIFLLLVCFCRVSINFFGGVCIEFLYLKLFFFPLLCTHTIPKKLFPTFFSVLHFSTHTQADTHTTPSYFIYDNVVVQCVSLLQKKWKKTLKKKSQNVKKLK